MRRYVNGMHISNHKHWYVEHCLSLDDGRGAMTILHHLMFERDSKIGQFGDSENAFWYWKLRHGWAHQGIQPAPDRFVHIRLFQPKWSDYDPKDLARYYAAFLSNWHFAGLRADLWQDPLVGISPCNEQNLEGHPTSLEFQARWQLDFWEEMDRVKPNRAALSVLGAWAYGGDWLHDVPDSEYMCPEVRELCDYVDVLATHPYAHLDWEPIERGRATAPGGRDAYWHMLRDFRPEGYRDQTEPNKPHDPGGILAQIPNKVLLISETGTFTHSWPNRTAETANAFQRLYHEAARSGRVLGVTPFIWSSGPEHGDNVIVGNAALRDAFINMPRYDTACQVPVHGQAPVPVPTPGPAPAPVPVPVPGSSQGEVHIVVAKSDGWTALARKLLGREPRRVEVAELRNHNDNKPLHPGECVRSPWHRAVAE